MVFACRIFGKTALQATFRIFGLCGSFVVLVWVVLWFLVTCGFLVCSARPFALCGSVVLPSMPGLARPLARRDCASSGFPYCQNAALELQALDRAPPLVVPTKRRACAWLELACWSLWSLWSWRSWRSSLPQWRLVGLRPLLLPRASPQSLPTPNRLQDCTMSEGARRWTPAPCKPTATKTPECARRRS